MTFSMKQFIVALLMPGVLTSPVFAEPEATEATQAELNLDTPLGVVADDPKGHEVLNKHMPELMTDPRWPQAKNMSLNQLKQFTGPLIPQDVVDAVGEDLADLNK